MIGRFNNPCIAGIVSAIHTWKIIFRDIELTSVYVVYYRRRATLRKKRQGVPVPVPIPEPEPEPEPIQVQYITLNTPLY